MSIKLIALDLDDTLLMPDCTVPDDVAETLRKAAAKGVKVVIATGRIYPSAISYAELLGSDCPVVCYNGSVIRRPGHPADFAAEIKPDLIRRVAAFCHRESLYLQLYADDRLAVEKVVEETRIDPDYHKAGAEELGDFLTAALKPTPKMLIVNTPQRLAEVRPALEAAFGGELHFATSKDYLLEMMPKGISKAKTLAICAESYGILPEECMVCGDNTNDLEMVSWAGLGVSVANGVPALKAVADYVAEQERSYGVKEAVEKFVLTD